MRFRYKHDARAVLLTVALAVAAFSGTAVAHGGDDGFHHHNGWMGTHGAWGGFGFLWMLLGGLLLVGIPALLVYAYANRGDSGNSGDEALSVLRQRYARGEIDEEEFENRRRKLSQTGETR